jgi:hypothetical protein
MTVQLHGHAVIVLICDNQLELLHPLHFVKAMTRDCAKI